MFIYHFNRLIRNRILWAFFAILIAVAFVAVDSCFRTPAEGQSAGVLNGKKITVAELDRIVEAIRGYGKTRDNKTPDHVVVRRAWEQIASVQNAKKNGMASTKEEIRLAIREMPAFQGPNGFDINRYRMILGAQGFTPKMYEMLLAHQLTVMKSRALVNSATWVSPMEMEDELAAMTDKFTVQVASISNTFLEADIKLTDEDYKKYYEENKKTYSLPEQAEVRYVAVPASNSFAAVSVSEADIQDYYDSNSDKFMRTATNGTSELIPFQEVRGKILDELKLQTAVYTISTAAAFRVYGEISDTNVDALAKFAREEKLPVKTSPLFGDSDTLDWVEDGAKFSEAVFELDPERIDSRFGIVEGEKTVYVVELLRRVAAHIQPYEEVQDDVKRQALYKARMDVFEKKAKDAKDAIEKAVANGKTFAEAAKAQALNVSTSVTYTVSDIQNAKFDNSFSVAYGAMTVQKGKISEPIPASSALSLFVYVQDRQPGDPLAAEMMRAQIRANISRRRSGQPFGDWLKWNLARQQFTPTRPLLPEDAKIDETSEPAISEAAEDE